MKAVILGMGQQGKAALHHLANAPEVEEVIAADVDLARAEAHTRAFGAGKTRCVQLDARDTDAVRRLFASGVDVAVCLLPAAFSDVVTPEAVRAGVHLVETFYTTPGTRKLHDAAKREGVAVLPEMGLDPGLDLLMAAQVLREFDEVHTFNSYGSGIPEPAASHNPLRYKISWTFAGVLRAYTRPARVIRDGEVVEFDSPAVFDDANTHHVQVEGLGELEAHANGDAEKYVDLFGLDRAALRDMGRFTLRWPGHCAFWRTTVALGFLGEDPVRVGDADVTPGEFVRALLEPQLQYGPTERDVAFLRVEVRGLKDGAAHHAVCDLIDYRDLDTGLLAMNRTVGYPAAIAARQIVSGGIPGRGVLSPVRDVDPDMMFDELEQCGIRVTRVV